jgi:recombination directionality factor gp3-like protein
MTTDLTVPGDSTPAPYDRPQVPTIARDIVAPRLPEVGRIRLGEKRVVTKTNDGKEVEVTYPAKIDAFRFTSRNRPPLEMVAELWGGEVKPWASDEGTQWQVYTTATSIECIVPKAELAFSQHFEDWEGAVCNRRCDGHYEMVGDRACVCDPAARKCLPTTRLSVLLPDVPGMGVWRVESHGYNAAAEILGTIELAAAHGATLLPATLSLEQRSKRRLNPKTNKVETNRFVVPVLSISASLREMVAEQHVLRQRTLGLLPMAEPATPDRMRALRTAVFSRWPESIDEPERSIRLRQLSALLGRPVTTISNDHDLTAQEAIFLANAVNELPDEDTQPALTREQGHVIVESPAWEPAPDHTQGSAEATPAMIPDQGPRSSGRRDTPAEHHTAEVLGEEAPADGTVPEGQGRNDTGLPAGAAPTPPARTRRRTDPTGAPKVAQAQKDAQAFRDERRQQTEVKREPNDPIRSMPPTFRQHYLDHFKGDLLAAQTEAQEHITEWEAARKWPATGPDAPWNLELLQELAADTFEKYLYR